MVFRGFLFASLFASLLCGVPAVAVAAVTPEQKKQIIEINKSMSAVAAKIRKKEYAEAEEVLKAAETRIEEIAKEADIETKDKVFNTAHKTIATHRKNLDKAQGKTAARPRNQGVSFTKDVAPLINEKCVGCHGATGQSGGLRLDNFAGWIKGGRSGQLLTAGSPQQSLLLFRMATSDTSIRMPKEEDPIDREKLAIVANWISQGARFDGDDQEAPLATLRTAEESKEEAASMKIVAPKGTEKVSFTRDVAPFMANLCVGCHSGNQPRGGLSLETFYDMLRGGDSGKVVLPGEPKEMSRLFRLTGGLELPRMPQGQARITRKNYEDLKTWFDEGCVYDGVDPKTPLRTFVKSEAEQAMERAARMSPAQFETHRKERTTAALKKALPNDTPITLESEDLLIVGNASEDRMKQVETWSKEHVATLRKGFGMPGGTIWKGRLAVILLKDRFGYEEFHQTVEQRTAAAEMHAHLEVTPTLDECYVVLEDVGDEVSAASPGLRVHLIDQLTGAYLCRTGVELPNWLQRGTGLTLASKVVGRNAYIEAMSKEAATIVPTLPNPGDVFQDASFSPSSINAVGLTLVEFLRSSGGPSKLGEFVKALESGTGVDEAITQCYGVDSATLGARFRDAIKGR